MKKYLLSMLCCTLFFACSTEDLKDEATTTTPCLYAASNLSVKTLETEYGCTNTRYNMHINLQDTFTIIQTQTAFTQKVSGSCMPTVDFTAYDLVIGKKGLNTDNQSINYAFNVDCSSGGMVELKVIFKQTLASAAPNVTYHVLVPKALNITPQKLKVLYQYQ